MDALGSAPQCVIDVLESTGVGSEIRTALDLCCGKGATSVALARRFGMRIDGIDAIDAFIHSAKAVLLPGAPARPGFEAHAGLEETRSRSKAAGVEVVVVRRLDDEATDKRHDGDNKTIDGLARALVERRPELADLVQRYVERQKDECAYLERWTREVM